MEPRSSHRDRRLPQLLFDRKARGYRRSRFNGRPSLPDNGCGFAGYGRLIDRGYTIDDLPVGGMISPASTVNLAPLRNSALPTFSSWPSTSLRAGVSERVFLRDSACALPRASARASAKLAKRTVSSSQEKMAAL